MQRLLTIACGDYDRTHPLIDGTVTSLFKAFQRAKEIVYQKLNDVSAYKISLAWFREPVADQENILGPDPWAYGLARNRHIVETLMTYPHEQGLVERTLPVEELFAANTLKLE